MPKEKALQRRTPEEHQRGGLQTQSLEVNPQIVIDIDLDLVLERILQDVKRILFKEIHKGCPASWVNNPIFPNTIVFIIIELADIII